MADAIGPGDWVECVDASPGHVSGHRLTLFGVYQVIGTNNHACHCGTPGGLKIAGAETVAIGWCVRRFRPIYRPNSEIIEALKAPAPSEPVPA